LTFAETERGTAKSIRWLYVDFVVKVSSREKRYYNRSFPEHAVQVNSPSKYPPPPFAITPRLTKALRAALKTYTIDRLLNAKTDVPSVSFVSLIEREYKSAR